MSSTIAQNNPLMDFADKHSLKKPGFIGGAIRGVGRGLKYGARELEKFLVNPVFSGAVRSIFNAAPSPLSNDSTKFNDPNKRGMFGRRMNNQQNQMFDRTQTMLLSRIYQISVQSERHLRGINRLIGITKETNTLLKNFITPKTIKPVSKDLNPFELPRAANSNNRVANDNSVIDSMNSGGIMSALLGSISIGSSIPVIVRVLKKFLGKVLTKIPVIGPLIAVMMNLPDAIDVFEKEGLGAAFTDLISGTVQSMSFGLIDKEKFKTYLLKGFQSLYDGIMSLGAKISGIFTDIAEMIDTLLKKIKIGPIRIPDILGGGTIEWDPFKDGLKIESPPPPVAEPAGVGDQGGQSPYAAELDTVAYAEQFAARQDAADSRRDKNIEITGQWEGRRPGDVISPEELKREAGLGENDYLSFLRMLVDSGQVKLTDKPVSRAPTIQSDVTGARRTSNPTPLLDKPLDYPRPQTASSYVALPRRSLISTPSTSDRAETFVRRSETVRSTAQQTSAPVIINAPVTNVTGASSSSSTSQRTPMGSATIQNTWEIRASQGVLVGVP